jgi:DNA-binding CsgD family transcriptional regulator
VPVGSAFPAAEDPQGYGKLSNVSGRTTRIPPIAPPRRLFGYESETSMVVDAIAGENHLGALIIGAAGVGKTALVNTALSRLDADLSVTRLRGSENARVRNLGIFEILLSREGLGTDLPPGRALSVIGDLFARRSAGGSPLVVVDNADLVDDHSLAVLAQLTDARRIKIVIAAESVRPSVDLIAGLWLSGSVVRVDLDGIDEADAIAMINSIGLMETETRSVSELSTLAHGNPRLLERLLFGRSRTSGVETAITRAEQPSREVIETVSLIEAVPYDVLVGLASPRTIDSLAEDGLLAISKGRGGEVSMHEPVTAENVRAAIPPSRSLELLARFDSGADRSTLHGRALFGYVGWSISLGRVPTPKQVLEAATWGNSRGRYLESAEIIRTSGYRGPELDLELSRCEWGAGRLRQAREIIAPLVSEACLNPEAGAEEYLSRLASMELRLTDPRTPERLQLAWVRDRLASPADLGRLDATRARFELKGGRIASACSLAQDVYLNHACLVRHRLRACAFLGVAEVLAGRIELGLSYIAQARLMFELPGPESFEREDAVPQFFVANFVAGNWADARTVTDELTSSRRLTRLTNALIDLRTGNVANAHRSLSALNLVSDPSDIVDIAGMARSAHSLSAVLTHQRTDVISIAVNEEADASRHSWWASFEARLFDLQALAQTSPGPVAPQLNDLGTWAEEHGAHTLACLAWLEAGRLGHEQAIFRLSASAGRVDGVLGRLLRAVAHAFSTDDLQALITAAREALLFGAVVLCAQLSGKARKRAVAEGDAAATKEARILLGRSRRVLDFDTDGKRFQENLNELEYSIITGIVEGRTSAQIGEELHLSARTIEWHLGRLYRRVHVVNRQELREVVSEWLRK